MEAFLLAAGFGTRLGPLTRTIPKALAPVAGVPILAHVVRRLIAAGVERAVLNTHHLGEQIVEYVEENDHFGIEIVFSHEIGAPLETGGGLKHAAPLLRADAPFFIHNTDILTELPLDALYRAHLDQEPLVTLAVMERENPRYLLFDEVGLLGWGNAERGRHAQVREAVGPIERLSFSGIHVASPQLLDLIEEEGAFSIFDPYLRLSAAGYRILPYRVDEYQWTDIGSPERLAAASRMLEEEAERV